ncbi:MAG TPA: hypothetical protein DEQ34_10025 [Balneolaceae bacterium]|nr:hypothetical protein [Balneolaceae bacterium]|tara:strand:+ start:140075 stop:140458 length:384 start_codon:yes stop_codon:yes gene_type:complete
MVQNPAEFIDNYLHMNTSIELRSLEKVYDHGPLIGDLFIGGKHMFPRIQFGGPVFFDKEYIFFTVFTGSESEPKFKVGAFNLSEMQYSTSNDEFPVIDILKKEANRIFFYTDMEKQKLTHIDLFWVL